ncbi:hypothetical protein J2Z69_002351 [Paenibacillus shirakamiensis]|uniref:Signal transduction histidine kinase n=1 Tax=Paenibacillus shirakamiensis TaxID=1265935 RepID=A0ABS4JHV8_9BACL|nr:hypothetical protein [Paenibacillus shirakamiensis]MBP2001308.1 hypothetical protein [Paenibacillus shirakamiensis]
MEIDYTRIAVFIVVAFALGLVVIMNKNNIPPRLKRGIALSAAVMIVLAFIFLIIGFLG